VIVRNRFLWITPAIMNRSGWNFTQWCGLRWTLRWKLNRSYKTCFNWRYQKVQRRFTKKLKGLKNISYSDRLCRLRLPSLQLRHLHLDLTFCYKLVFSLVSVKFPDFFEFSLVQKTTGYAYKTTNCTNHVLTVLYGVYFLLRELWTCGMTCRLGPQLTLRH